jgi:acetyl-CoA/propionyl-CoA carboxylase biotin carboxyl carrier protein
VESPGKREIKRLLVANRGEIALRIMRACREMEIVSVAVYGDGEEAAQHVRYADEAYKLPPGSGLRYLDVDAVVAVAVSANVDAVHPGYGFLAENARFARAVIEAGLTFVGPSPEAIAAMGDKVEARKIAAAAGIHPVPGTEDPVADLESAAEAAGAVGYPVAVKAVGGGGGRGFRVARTREELDAAFTGSSGEAARYFANPEVYLERYLERPRHIEMQVFADTHGNVVSLGERDCSVQRRHQKLVEESPSVAVDDDLRRRLGEATVALAKAVDYTGAGTVEYLLDSSGSFHFLEMNTRIQVEHTVTEMVTGIDLVKEQIRVAMGRPLSFGADDVEPRGWAIECRVNAEDAGRDFAPSPGKLTAYSEPVGFGVRVDAALGLGDEVMPQFDSMIAKVITWGRDREEARRRMVRALTDYRIEGLSTTIPFHLNLLEHEHFIRGDLSTTFLAEFPEVLPIPTTIEEAGSTNGHVDAAPVELVVEVNGRRFETVIHGMARVANGTEKEAPGRPKRKGSSRGAASNATGDDLVSPIQGTVIRVSVSDGEVVEPGQVICVVEAMKMENDLVAHKAGVISGALVAQGATVSIGQVVATISSS